MLMADAQLACVPVLRFLCRGPVRVRLCARWWTRERGQDEARDVLEKN